MKTVREIGRASLVAAIAIVAAPLASCGGSPPEIVSVSYQINLVPEEGGRQQESLALVVYARDGDGAADFDVLYVINDAQELYWTAAGDGLKVKEEGDGFWVGVDDLRTADGSPVPRGRYRVVLMDRSGSYASAEVAIGAPDTASFRPPTFTIDGDAYSLDSRFPRNLLLIMDSGGKTKTTVEFFERSGSMDRLTGQPNWRESASAYRAYGYDAKTNIGAFSWIISP